MLALTKNNAAVIGLCYWQSSLDHFSSKCTMLCHRQELKTVFAFLFQDKRAFRGFPLEASVFSSLSWSVVLAPTTVDSLLIESMLLWIHCSLGCCTAVSAERARCRCSSFWSPLCFRLHSLLSCVDGKNETLECDFMRNSAQRNFPERKFLVWLLSFLEIGRVRNRKVAGDCT